MVPKEPIEGLYKIIESCSYKNNSYALPSLDRDQGRAHSRPLHAACRDRTNRNARTGIGFMIDFINHKVVRP